MKFNEVLIKRSSIRSFKNVKINDDDINEIINLTISAPSAGNLQAYKIYIIENKEMLNKLVVAAWGQNYISQANLAFVFCALPLISSEKYGNRGANLYSIQDATIAATYCQLAATSLNLASVWVGAFDDQETSKIMNLPESEIPVAIIPIGHANEIAYPTSRKNIDKVIQRIK